MTTLSKQTAINLWLVDYTPAPKKGDTYEGYLNRWDLLDRGFAYGEIVKPRLKDIRGKFKLPPIDLWNRMAITLGAANDLRLWMCEDWPNAGSARGLRINAAYRPMGGASHSQHKRNAALDLDLLPSDYDLVNDWYETATRFWCEHGRDLKMGLGLYCSSKRKGGIRVHIDTGYRCRTWQISGGRSIKPYTRGGRKVPLAYHICDQLGLVPPTEQEA